MSTLTKAIERAAAGEALPSQCASKALEQLDATFEDLCAAARERRERAWGRTVTFSPKAFLPVTNLCRNHCDYCTFRKAPDDPGAHTMALTEIEGVLDRASASGCIEALLCLGDKPEKAFSAYRKTLDAFGVASTVEHLVDASRSAWQRGMLAHTNAGLLNDDDMLALRPWNVSLGLMLESSSERLCERGMPHFRAPDKRPKLRIDMIRRAGQLQIPFTSGVLVGIGENDEELAASLACLAALHDESGHLQECIVQNFMPKVGTRMHARERADERRFVATIAIARLMLHDNISVQAPPNLSPARTEALLDAGINDFGGISPLTPDFINPECPWPQLHELRERCANKGLELQPRLPVYPRYLSLTWQHPRMLEAATQLEATLQTWWTDYAARAETAAQRKSGGTSPMLSGTLGAHR